MTIRTRSALVLFAVGLFASSLSVSASASTQGAERSAGRAPSRALADRDGNRIADTLDRALARGAARRDVVATFTDRASMHAARRGLAHVSTTFTLIDGFAARLTDGQIRALSHRSGVIRVEPNFRVHALDDAANDDFGVTGRTLLVRGDGRGRRDLHPRQRRRPRARAARLEGTDRVAGPDRPPGIAVRRPRPRHARRIHRPRRRGRTGAQRGDDGGRGAGRDAVRGEGDRQHGVRRRLPGGGGHPMVRRPRRPST